ncbi:UDP-N-acetylmuramoyl-tripeptide--D-alanyl-D-alanine ligase [Paenibacillus yonginensis]|uniref:UDP-N-acetylmuramoyl-tripeptide--D-alanyl-D-alanine ligase n=1 Tax=Paenibacillus yonginensis TaxID=1462996 RepID=A0A1B1N124_9BACL|nr:UDP-N-acetylmuramoyl-tripeptide--D-alanyl-D-alanine ligase [Paenibacillus yonginensis]ANS75115.1 UDP-N-acetylmuramoyl-tripeptide--D-alanyl-D-alanine ligase [Paenibacillus yonginensis]
MITRTLQEIAAMCGGQLIMPAGRENGADARIQGVTTDSRKLSENVLFVPLTGENFDGHHFAAESLRQGAGAVLWSRSRNDYPAEGPVILVEDTLSALQQLAKAYLEQCGARVIGITGSNGKTTTKDIVTSLLSTTYKVHKTQGNYNNHIGLPLTILSMPEDTEMAVLEMGMSARREIELLSSIARPETAIVTNIGESHLEHLGSREEIARAKLEILAGMKPNGLFVYNGDEPLIPQVLGEPGTVKPEGLQTVTFGLSENNDLYPTGMMFLEAGTTFTASRYYPQTAYTLPLLGKHNVANALAAMAVAAHYEVSAENIRKGLEQTKLTGMRIELLKGTSGVTILNDAYNASPTSVRAALEVLASMNGYSRRIAVLGDMLELGADAERMHKDVGLFVTPDKADLVFAYGPLGAFIAEGAAEQLPAGAVQAFVDKTKLIEALEAVIRPDDVVLIKASRGNRLEEVAQAVQHFTGKQS